MLRHGLHENRTGYRLLHLQTWLQEPLFTSKHGSRVRADAAAMVTQPEDSSALDSIHEPIQCDEQNDMYFRCNRH